MIETTTHRPVRTAVIPVAGFGTRMLPATKSVPKELLPVVDRPVLDYVVDEAREAGIEHIVFVTGRGKEAIEDHYDHMVELETTLEAGGKTKLLEAARASVLAQGHASFVRQGKALGLGHAVWCARWVVGDEPFAVLLPDMIVNQAPGCLASMMALQARVGGNVIAVNEVPDDQTHRYGVIATGATAQGLVEVSALVEKPPQGTSPSNLAVTGRYILQPEVFDILETVERGAGGEFQLTDAMAKLIGKQAFNAYTVEGPVYDTGDRLGWLEANIAMALHRDDMVGDVKDLLVRYAKG